MTANVEDLVGHALHASDHRPVGKIAAVYQYPADLRAPAGAASITTGPLHRPHLVDLEGAEMVDGVVTVPHDRKTITRAPNFTPLMGYTLSEGNAVKVREHYWGASQPA